MENISFMSRLFCYVIDYFFRGLVKIENFGLQLFSKVLSILTPIRRNRDIYNYLNLSLDRLVWIEMLHYTNRNNQ